MNSLINIQGYIRLQQYRDGKLLRDYGVRNKITWQGKQDLMNQFFKGTVTWTNFYVGLLINPVFTENQPALATLFAQEFATYDEATRPALTLENANSIDDASYIYIQNLVANYAVFTISTGVLNQVLRGVYIVGTDTKAVQPTRCWCTAAFGNNDSSPEQLTVNASDVLRIQYTIRIPKA
jgi:hypothetical protein